MLGPVIVSWHPFASFCPMMLIIALCLVTVIDRIPIRAPFRLRKCEGVRVRAHAGLRAIDPFSFPIKGGRMIFPPPLPLREVDSSVGTMDLRNFLLLFLMYNISFCEMRKEEVSIGAASTTRPLGNGDIISFSPTVDKNGVTRTSPFFHYPKGRGWKMARCVYPATDGKRPSEIWCLYPPRRTKERDVNKDSGKRVMLTF